MIQNYNYHLKTNVVTLKGEIELWKTKWMSSDKNTDEGNIILYNHNFEHTIVM